jgi:DNA-binding transcriptional LysR family regulator
VARDENMTKAANRMHISQSALSRQLRNLEDELGCKLFIRHSFSIELTPEGQLLRKRARDLIEMADKIEDEFSNLNELTGGSISIGCAESYLIEHLAAAIKEFKKSYPNFHYQITSGDSEQVLERLDNGLLDFALIVEAPNLHKYYDIKMPGADCWGLVFKADDPLAKKEQITFEDLKGLPLLCSEQSWQNDVPRWAQTGMEELHLEGSFRLAYNGSLFAKTGLGYLLTFEHLIDTSAQSGLVFRPLYPQLTCEMHFVYRRHQMFSPIAQKFLEHIQETFSEQ